MRKKAGAETLKALMAALGRKADAPASIYVTGGATAVLLGWRETTVAVDIHLVPGSDRLLRTIPDLKESLSINVELASPAHFIPELPGWRDRSIFIGKEGPLSFFHYDLYSQALAKLERGHEKDRGDVKAMIDRKLVDPGKALELFPAIEPRLYLFPSIDPSSFRRSVEEGLSPG
jgi:hypothetical protein